jgi:hypothetical protein
LKKYIALLPSYLNIGSKPLLHLGDATNFAKSLFLTYAGPDGKGLPEVLQHNRWAFFIILCFEDLKEKSKNTWFDSCIP